MSVGERQNETRRPYHASFVHLEQCPRELDLFQHLGHVPCDIHERVFIVLGTSDGDILGGIRQEFGVWMVPSVPE